MPLNQSSSEKARSENIATEIKAGKPRDQAIAIGYSVQRKASGKKTHRETGRSTGRR
jgi:hypothetical protein